MTKCGHVRDVTHPNLHPSLIPCIGVLLSVHPPPGQHLRQLEMGSVPYLLRLNQREAAQVRQVV